MSGGEPKRYDELKRFLDEKAWAYMHDPIAKPYFVLHPEEGHESEALKEFNIIWAEDVLEHLSTDLVKKADVLGSILDRRWTGMFHDGLRGVTAESNYIFKNTFDPRFSITLREPYDSEVNKNRHDNVLKALRRLMELFKEDPPQWSGKSIQSKEVVRRIIKYHLLYFYSEPLWIAYCGEPLPADTRIPTHTVFDHISATASIYNLIAEGGGFLVRIDLGGIQEFISASRKVRDLWASSYMLSMIVWAALKPLIFVFGPDIVLVPTMRMNPTYHFQLNIWVREIYSNAYSRYINPQADIKRSWYHIAESIMGGPKYGFRELFKGIYGESLNETIFSIAEGGGGRAPPYALIPAIFTLVLPPLKVIKQGIQLLLDITSNDSDYQEEKATFYGVISKETRETLKKFLDTLESSQRKESQEEQSGKSPEELIEDLIESLIKAVWKEVYRNVVLSIDWSDKGSVVEFISSLLPYELSEKKTDGSADSLRDDVAAITSKYVSGFDSHPPFITRVGAVHFSSKFRNIIDGAKDNPEHHGVSQSIIELLNHELVKKFANKYRLRNTPYAYKHITEITNEIYQARRGGIVEYGQEFGLGVKIELGDDGVLTFAPINIRGFDYCTMCSSLPAIIHLHRNVEMGSPHLSPGEKLCPVCLLKRLIGTKREFLDKFVKIIFSDSVSAPKLEVLSTSDVANMYLGEKLAEKKEILMSPTHQNSQEREEEAEDENEAEGCGLFAEGELTTCNDITWLCRTTSQALVTFEDEDMPLGLLNKRDEASREKRMRWRSCIEKYFNFGDRTGVFIYYGIFITDADRMGKIVSGELYRARIVRRAMDEASLRKEELDHYVDYIRNSLNIPKKYKEYFDVALSRIREEIWRREPWKCGDCTRIVECIVNIVMSELVDRGIFNNMGSAAGQRFVYGLLMFFFKPVMDGSGSNKYKYIYSPRVVPSPTYLASVSRSLMLSLLEDVKTVSEAKGIVIYAGGDDLLALIPLIRPDFVEKCAYENFLGVMERVRTYYSHGDGDGFTRIPKETSEGYCIPMLVGLGRSQTLLMTHYRTPMGKTINLAHRILDEVAKDGSKWIFRGGGGNGLVYERDGLAITSYSGGFIDIDSIPLLPCLILNPSDGGRHIPRLIPAHQCLGRMYVYVYGGGTSVDKDGSECRHNILSRSFLRDYAGDIDYIRETRALDQNLYLKTIGMIIDRNKTVGNGEEVTDELKEVMGYMSLLSNICLSDGDSANPSKTCYINALDKMIEVLLEMNVAVRRADL